MTTFQGTETYLIECSRENSAINIDDDDDTNGSWANETDFVIKRGDRISVEMVCANIRGSGTAAPTIEFSGQNVVVNGETKNYCDTKVLLEVFFYMNNNNTYSVGMPLIHPFGGINGQGTSGNYDNLVTPINLNPRIPMGNVTNQTYNYREVNMGEGYVYPNVEFGDWGIWDGTPPEPAYLNQPGNEIPPLPIFSSRFAPAPPVPPVTQTPFARAYQIYQFKYILNGAPAVWGAPEAGLPPTLPQIAGDRVVAIRIAPHNAAAVAQTTPPYQAYNQNCLFTDYDNGILKGRTGQEYQNNFYVGNHIFINNNVNAATDILQVDWIGEIEKIQGASGLGNPAFNVRVLQIEFKDTNAGLQNQPFGYYYGAQTRFGFECGDCAVYVGGIYKDLDDNVYPKFDIKPGSSQEGLINYDNLELSTIPVVNYKYEGNGYMRGNNALFLYSRNTREPQTGQDANLRLFPNTEFKPDTVTGSSPAQDFYTTDAGEYGNLPAASQFGYRNANIQQENNNDPYIFMRNDHFGRGRRGMNNERMPDAEPMTAFIYVSLKELLQDVNSVSNVINQRIRETITGLGTTTQQTSKLLVNSLENPKNRKPASNVVPYYNRVGFYDRSVTTDNQNTLMLDTNNAQYRNIVTDIIPIKNGGTVKVNPANFTSGRNYLAQSYGKQYGGIPGFTDESATQAQLNNNKETTYLREIETGTTTDGMAAGEEQLTDANFKGWANPIYGNMATADLYKYQLGDRWGNLPVWNCDRVDWKGGDEPITRQVGKTIILNNKLTYKTLSFTQPNGTNGYTGQLSNFPNQTPEDLIANRLWENQLIYTNIPFPQEDDEYGSWAKFAKALRNYETYYNTNDNAPVTYSNQRKDINGWIFDGDVGMTDDRSTAQLRTQQGAPRHEPPNTDPDYPIIAPPPNPPPAQEPRFQNNRPFYYDWLNQPSTEASVVTDPTYGTALGLPEPIQSPAPAGGLPDPDYRPVVYGANRTLICPTTSHEIFAGVSATSNVDEEEKYKMLKELGRLKMKSRFDPNFYKKAKNFQGLSFPSAHAPPVLTQDFCDIGFTMANNNADPDYNVNTTFIRQLDIGFYPYQYKRGDGSTITMCAIMVGAEYDPDANVLNTINFGSMVWGQTIGISNSFFDNHAICPMNNDQVKRGQPLTKTVVVPGSWEEVGIQNTLNIEQNEYYQAPSSSPLGAATYNYTQVAGTDPQRITTDLNLGTNFLAAPYINAAGRFRCRLQLSGCFQFPGASAQVIWEQSSLFTAAAVTGFTKVSTDTPEFYDPSHPAGFNFTGLYINPLFNGDNTIPLPNPVTATNTWILTSGSGIQNYNPAASLDNKGIGIFQARGLGEPGAYHNGYYYSADPTAPNQFIQFETATLSVYRQPQITPSPDTIKPNLGLEYNKVNYVWCGATQPTFQYAQDKGRVEFVQLQDDNILNQKSIPYTDEKINPSATTGTKAGIINTAAEDAVFSRNSRQDDFVNSEVTAPVKNSGIRAEISGIGIYKIWLCPENYEPPNNVNLSSYWNNADESFDENGDLVISYWGQTEIQRQKIIKNCVEADEGNWAGSLFERLGFQSHRELLPAYGKQQNRYNPTTFNQSAPDKINRGTKPLILCNAVDNSIDPALNTYFTMDASGNDVNGIPMYSNGFLNDESVSLQLVNQSLTASAPPILSTSPFLLIESDICSTNYRSGRTQQNVLFYLMKNYQASSFIYGYGSSYTHTANQDRMLSLINTAFRDPITGRLQKCSNNSTIIYKIQRDIEIPPPQTDALGNPLVAAPAPESKTDELLSQIVQNTESNTSRGQGTSGAGGGGGGGGGGGLRSGGGGGFPGGGGGAISRIGDDSAPPNVPLFQDTLLVKAAEDAGANMNIIGGQEALVALRQTFAEIAADPDIDPTEEELQDATAFIIQQLLSKYPIELIRASTTGQVGMYNPSWRGEGTMEGQEFLDDSPQSAYNLAQSVVIYLRDQFRRLGSNLRGGMVGGIRDLFNFDMEGDERADLLAELVGSIQINPITGQQIGEYGEPMINVDGMNEFGYLTFARQNSTSFLAISQIFTQILENEEQFNQAMAQRDNLPAAAARRIRPQQRGEVRTVPVLTADPESQTAFPQAPLIDGVYDAAAAEGQQARRERIREEYQIEQARLMDRAVAVFSRAITAGNRISLADPQQEWIQPQLGAQLQGLSPERYARMRELDTTMALPESAGAEGFAASFSAIRRELGGDYVYDGGGGAGESKYSTTAEDLEALRAEVGERQTTPPSSPRVGDSRHIGGGESKRGELEDKGRGRRRRREEGFRRASTPAERREAGRAAALAAGFDGGGGGGGGMPEPDVPPPRPPGLDRQSTREQRPRRIGGGDPAQQQPRLERRDRVHRLYQARHRNYRPPPPAPPAAAQRPAPPPYTPQMINENPALRHLQEPE